MRLAFGPESLWFHFISVPLVDQPISSLLAGFSSHVNGSHHLFSSRRVSVACRRSKGSRRFALSVAITLPPDEGRQQRAFALLIASDIPTLTYTSDSREREKKTSNSWVGTQDDGVFTVGRDTSASITIMLGLSRASRSPQATKEPWVFTAVPDRRTHPDLGS